MHSSISLSISSASNSINLKEGGVNTQLYYPKIGPCTMQQLMMAEMCKRAVVFVLERTIPIYIGTTWNMGPQSPSRPGRQV